MKPKILIIGDVPNLPSAAVLAALTGSAYHCELCDTNHPKNAGCHDERPIEIPGERMPCPHCGSGLLWSEDRGAHCDGCDDFNPETDFPNDRTERQTPGCDHDGRKNV